MTEETIFSRALEESDPVARSAFLAEACAGDSNLRRRVEALVRTHENAGEFLNQPALKQLGAAPCHSATEAFDPSTGRKADNMAQTEGEGASDHENNDLGFLQPSHRADSLGRIGHYEVLQVLGKGGFGIVFRAFDDTLQRVVALKVMAPQLAATSPARKRFLREARSSAQIRHENVVQVYEVGETPFPYLAMEFIPGETLQQRLDRIGPIEPIEVVRFGRQIAEGLAAAHATDLIHRDIKPGNILIEGGQQKAKITDFGLARAADDASISQSGIIAGTPMYMAPEQAKGEKLDQRADLFSLGSVLYQMAAGRPPFRANNTVAVLKRVAEDTPRDIREIIPETPQWLCDIIAKLHAKNPDERYQSAREVADVLADCEAQLKANAKLKDYSRIPRGKQQPSGRRKRVAAAAVLLLPVIVLAVTEFAGVTHLFWGRASLNLNKPSLLAERTHEVPKQSAEILRFIQGTWKRDSVVIVPKPVVENARSFGQLTFDPVADGKVMRGLTVDEHNRSTTLILHSYDSVKDQIRSWYFSAEGETNATNFGVYDPTKHTLLWAEKFPDDTHSYHLLDFADANTVRSTNYDTDKAGNRVYESRATFTRTDAAPAVPKHVIDPKRPSEMQLLDRFLGEWRHEITVTSPGASNQPKREVQRTKAQLILGGWMIETIDVNETTNTSDYSVLWYDNSTKQYRLWAFLSNGQVFDLRGTWNEATKTMTFTSSDGVHSGETVFQGDDGYLFRRNAKNAAGEVVFDARSEARRVVPASSQRAAQPSNPPAAPDCVRLFNGKDLAGWKLHPDRGQDWQVEQGVLVGRGPSAYLFSERSDYQDFHIRVEARINDTASGGLWVRSSFEPRPPESGNKPDQPLGYSANIATFPNVKTGGLWYPVEDGKWGGVPSPDSSARPDEWFTLEVVARGNHIVVLVNGEKTAEYTDPNHTCKRGHFALQANGPNAVVQFRKIEIKELLVHAIAPPPNQKRE